MSDDYHELGSGFNYIGEGGSAHYISGGDIIHNTLIYGNVKSFNSDDTFIVAKQEPDLEEYRSEVGSELWANYYRRHDFNVDSVEWKKNWPKREVYEIRKFVSLYTTLKRRGVSLKNSAGDVKKCEAVADSLLKIEPYYQNIFRRKYNYWIIDKKSTIGYGPYDSIRFEQECKRFGINLELESHY